MSEPEMNYSSYLQVEKLLDLQDPKSDPVEHDELLFIIIHQVYELWFRQMLHEIDKVKTDFSDGELFGAIAAFQRLRTIMKTLVFSGAFDFVKFSIMQSETGRYGHSI